MGWPSRPDRVVDRFLGEIGEATRREEVHHLLLRAAQELTGADRVELRAIGEPYRVLLNREATALSSQPALSLPIRYRDELLGMLLITPGRRRAISKGTVAELTTLCAIAAIGDRLLGRVRHLQLAASATSPNGRPVPLKPRDILLPFLRQLVLLGRRRREPLSVLAIGLERRSGSGILARDPGLMGMIDPALVALRESDLVVQDDDRTLIAVLPNASSSNAPVVAESIVRSISERTEQGERPETAIGIACYPDDAQEADVLLDVSLEALRRARMLGGGRIVTSDRDEFIPREVSRDGSSRAG